MHERVKKKQEDFSKAFDRVPHNYLLSKLVIFLLVSSSSSNLEVRIYVNVYAISKQKNCFPHFIFHNFWYLFMSCW